MNQQEREYFVEKCKDIRALTIDEIATLGVGHLGGCMSVVEIMVMLYYKYMNIDPKNPKMEGRDRLVLSKAHAGPTLYSILADKGYFDKSELKTLNQPGTHLPSHANMVLTTGVDMTAGSLGQGLSCATGAAIGSKLRKDGATIYCIMGDGEINEGQIWEAASYASHMKLDNLIAFVDANGMQLDGETWEVNKMDPLMDKWRSFGWRTLEVDGHDVNAIDAAIATAKTFMDKPTVIICRTLKGKGVSFLEASWKNNHNVKISPEQRDQALEELGRKGE
ncbi:MAG: transketolase [Clostridiales bacterium]|nr:transketolase [Clostridiales bacterium]